MRRKGCPNIDFIYFYLYTHCSPRGLIDAEAAYNRLSNGCEYAGGSPLEPGDTPLGGKDQLGAQPTPPPTPAPTIFCAGVQKQVEVNILTDNYPSETTWTVTDKCGNGGIVLSGGPYSSSGTTESSSSSVCEGEYEFQINVSYCLCEHVSKYVTNTSANS